MAECKLWYRLPRGRSAHLAEEVLARVSRLGFELTAWTSDVSGPGIVFLSAPDSDLNAFIVEASRCGANRVIAVCIETALASEAAWSLLNAGAEDVVAETGAQAAAAAVAARLQRWSEIDRLIESPLVRQNLIGRSAAWINTLRVIVEAASFTSAPILLEGESGTGKELLARLIHSLDPRPDKKELIVLDCTTIVPELSGSEFFGHEKGAFTGAAGARDGVFARANGGTLLLDEVGELPLRLQAQLLRVVQEHTYKRVGGDTWHRTEFRLVCATNRDLQDMVAQGRFRADLYYRIASVTCRTPALRERREDILPLFKHFLATLRPSGSVPDIDEVVRDFLVQREYPGNVRDLRQLAMHVGHRYPGAGPITAGLLPVSGRPSARDTGWRTRELEAAIRSAVFMGGGLKEISRVVAETAIRVALDESSGNTRSAARMLGITDRALQMRRAGMRANGSAGEDDQGINAEPVQGSPELVPAAAESS